MNSTAEKKIPLTRIQKIIGKLMLQSKQQVPYCYLESQADMTDLSKMRKPYCKSVGVRVTTNDFFFSAIAHAIKKFPLLAGKIGVSRQIIEINPQINVGFAVAAPQGLVVPVIKDLDKKNLPQIAFESNELLEKARSNKLMPDDFYGASVVLTSLGMYGIDSFYAIAPPGATGIISIGKPDNNLVVADGEITTRKLMSVALAFDRTVLNDFYAAKFLNYVIEKIENPTCLTD